MGETPFRTLSVKLRGIPGPGPARWIAALLALVAVGAGVVLGGRPASPSPTGSSDAASTTEARRADLLARARSLRVQREAGEIGPEYEAEQLAFLTDELAALLLQAGRAAAAKG